MSAAPPSASHCRPRPRQRGVFVAVVIPPRSRAIRSAAPRPQLLSSVKKEEEDDEALHDSTPDTSATFSVKEEQVDTSLKTDEDEYVKPIIPDPDIKVKIEVEPLEPSLTFESPDNPLRPWTFGLSILADYCSISRARLDKGFFRQRKQHGQDIPWSDILGGQQTTMGMHVSGNRADNAGPKCPGYPIMMLSGGDHFTKLLKSFELSLVKSAFFPPSHLIDARNDWRYYGEVQMVGGANASALRRFGPDDLRRLTRSEQKEWVHFTRPQKGQKGYSRKPIPEADYDGIIGRMTAQGAAWSLGYVLFECVGFNEEKLKIWEARRTKRLSFNGKQWPQKGSDEGVLLIAEAKAESKRYRQVYETGKASRSTKRTDKATSTPSLAIEDDTDGSDAASEDEALRDVEIGDDEDDYRPPAELQDDDDGSRPLKRPRLRSSQE